MTESILNGRSAAEFCFANCQVRLYMMDGNPVEGAFAVADTAGIAVVVDGVARFHPWHSVWQVTLVKIMGQHPEDVDD